MRLEGSIAIAAPAQAVWDLMVDPVTLASCVPGVDDLRQVDERTFEGSITAAVGPIEGHFSFVSVLTETTFPDSLRVEVTGMDSVTKSRLETGVHAALVAIADEATRLDYDATVVVKGRLAILGEMVLRATAGVMIAQVTRCLRARLESEQGRDPGSGAGGAIADRPSEPAAP